MPLLPRCHTACALALALLASILPAWTGSGRAAAIAPEAKVDYPRDIRPILSDNCYACHGPDEAMRKAKLRLDTKIGAFGKLRGGGFALVPGDARASVLLRRVSAGDPTEVMPPPKTGKHLTPGQIDLLRRWIDQGAPWTGHWAFTAPTRPPLPKVADATWPRNPIDYFVLNRLEAEGLHPAPEADKITLLRRVTLDLTGLPPTPEEVDAFLADSSPDAYEKVVDRLLRSPRYGEHLTRFWLDAARYGDTHGLHLDNYREIWPYREWVIKAFNANMPFDRFLVEQLAGDLLPQPTLDQIVATGYDRCNVTTSEGGAIEEEVHVRNVVDRVDTFGTALLGLTTGCARCHDHKFDPLTQKEYYQLSAFFNSLDGKPLDGNAAAPPPVVKVPSAEQAAALERLQGQHAAVQRQIAGELARAAYDDRADAGQSEVVQRLDHVWFDDDLPPGAKPANNARPDGHWDFVSKPDYPVFSGSKAVLQATAGLGNLSFSGANPKLRLGEGDSLFTYVFLDPVNPPKEIMLQWSTGAWLHRAYWGENLIDFGKDGTTERLHVGPLPVTGKWVRLEVEASKLGLPPGTLLDGWACTQFGGEVYWDRAGIETWTPQEGQPLDTFTAWVRQVKVNKLAGLPPDIQQLVRVARSQRNEAQRKQLRDYFVEYAYARTRPTFDPLHAQLAAIDRERAAIDKAIPTTLVFRETSQPLPAYVLKRGEYDKRGEQVGREVPAFLPPLPAGAPHNRLGLAEWLVAPNHPLTARVMVNRFWQQCFGTGIVKTAEDFGAQGEAPSHPELLDWLAVQFREGGWDVKRTMKRIVLSATYRQSSRISKEKLAKDPANRLLSRGPRFRLDAEMLRDQALAVSGLLVEHLGGPSVKPPQPAGLWEAVGYTGSNTVKFVADTGPDKVHRRSLYTFWKRTSPPPQMTAFDAPSRETCIVRRERTNTPLQALLLLNGKQYVECARALAERAMHEGGEPEARLTYLFRLATGRRPDPAELAELLADYRDHLATYAQDVEKARLLIAVGETKADAALNPSELAAWTMVANLILNLDEVISKG